MTLMIRHRTELADAKARNSVPQQMPAVISKAPANESALGLAMLKLARKEGHRARVPGSWDDKTHGRNGQEAKDVTESMFKFMADWIVPVDIAAKVSADLGREVKVQLINNRLHSNKSGRFASKQKTKRTRFWRLAK